MKFSIQKGFSKCAYNLIFECAIMTWSLMKYQSISTCSIHECKIGLVIRWVYPMLSQRSKGTWDILTSNSWRNCNQISSIDASVSDLYYAYMLNLMTTFCLADTQDTKQSPKKMA